MYEDFARLILFVQTDQSSISSTVHLQEKCGLVLMYVSISLTIPRYLTCVHRIRTRPKTKALEQRRDNGGLGNWMCIAHVPVDVKCIYATVQAQLDKLPVAILEFAAFPKLSPSWRIPQDTRLIP